MSSRRDHSQSPDPALTLCNNHNIHSNFMKPISEYDQWRGHIPQSQMYSVNNSGPIGDSMMGSYMPGFYPPPPPPPMPPNMNYYGNGWPGFYPPSLQSANPATPLYGHHPMDHAAGMFSTGANGLFNYLPGSGAGDYDAWASPVREPSAPSAPNGQAAAVYSNFRMAPPSQSSAAGANHSTATNANAGLVMYNSGAPLTTAGSNVRPIEHAFSRLLFELPVNNDVAAAAHVVAPTDGNSSVVHSLMSGGSLGVGVQLNLGHQISVATGQPDTVTPQHHHQTPSATFSAPQQQQSSKKTWASIVKQPDRGVTTATGRNRRIPISGMGCAPSATCNVTVPPPPQQQSQSVVTANAPEKSSQALWTVIGGALAPEFKHQLKPFGVDNHDTLSNACPVVNGKGIQRASSNEDAAAGNNLLSVQNNGTPPDKISPDIANTVVVKPMTAVVTSPTSVDSSAKVTGDFNSVVGNGSSFHSVLDKLRQENNYNPREFSIVTKGARYFVVKSYNEDDFHRSIKYGIWCSTEHGNKRLDQTFRERGGKGPVYIFASVNGSGHFCGVAHMTSAVDYSKSAGVWAQDKYKGNFTVQWVYVKDVPNAHLRHIRLENNENKPVTNSRDAQEVPAEKGKQVLRIIHAFQHTTSLFDDFTHYEKRERDEEERKKRSGGAQKDA